MSRLDIETIAENFWTQAGLLAEFPRHIEQAIAVTLPLALVKLPMLNAKTVGRWLELRSLSLPLPNDKRDLMGCLIAHQGKGIIFINGADTDEEQRYTLAHEAAHFIVDYLTPRQEVILALGEQVVAVLDGFREATPGERLDAVLSHIRLSAHIHIMPRDNYGKEPNLSEHIESRADALALELIAPKSTIISVISQLSAQGVAAHDEVLEKLASHFGLPPYVFYHLAANAGQKRPVQFLEDVLASIRGRSVR